MEKKKFIIAPAGNTLVAVDDLCLSPNEMGSIAADEIPGVLTVEDKPCYPIGKRLFPVTGCVFKDGAPIPIIDIPLVDGEIKEAAAV